MGSLIDTDVWVLAEKSDGTLGLSRWTTYVGDYIYAVTASELLAGVKQAYHAPRRACFAIRNASKLHGNSVKFMIGSMPFDLSKQHWGLPTIITTKT